MDNKGVATAVGSGRVIVTGSIQDPVSLKIFQVSTVLTVVPQLTGITISPASAQIAKGTAQQFTATAKYNDGTSPDPDPRPRHHGPGWYQGGVSVFE